MRPVDQTTFGPKDALPLERGDCLRAALCSVLELKPGDVPHFAAGDQWLADLQDFLEPRNLTAFLVAIAVEDEPPVPRIRCGPSPRGDWLHAVAVYSDGTVHDPHPSRAGFDDREADGFTILLLALDPAALA